MNHVLANPETLSQSVGGCLRQARQQRQLSLDDIASRTFIKRHYLEALEADHFSHLPAAVYTTGYIRQYARALHLDEETLVQAYQTGQQIQGLPTAAPGPDFELVVSQPRRGEVRIENLRQPLEEPQQERIPSMSTPPAVPSQQKEIVDTIDGARKEALAVRHQTEQFADQVLSHLESELKKTLSVVQNGRGFLQQRLKSYRF